MDSKNKLDEWRLFSGQSLILDRTCYIKGINIYPRIYIREENVMAIWFDYRSLPLVLKDCTLEKAITIAELYEK